MKCNHNWYNDHGGKAQIASFGLNNMIKPVKLIYESVACEICATYHSSKCNLIDRAHCSAVRVGRLPTKVTMLCSSDVSNNTTPNF